MPPLPLKKIDAFWQAQAFAKPTVDLLKGSKFVEPMCDSNGRNLSSATAAIINEARNDAMVFAYNNNHQWQNPYLHKSETAFRVYADVAVAAIEEDKLDYRKVTRNGR